MKLKNLTKHELLHLVEDVVGGDDKQIKAKLVECLEIQHRGNLKCWDCEAIAKKLLD